MDKQQMKRGCRWALIGILVVPAALLVLIIGVFALLAFGWANFENPARAVDEYPDLATVWSYGSGDVKVVRIPVTGVISSDAESEFFLPLPSTAERVLRQIRAATEDDEIRGIILEIDSPGGDVTACDEIHHALREFKTRDQGRVIVAIFYDLAASGGYYVACGADYIIAQPTTVTGSIGVLISAINFRELGQKIGVHGVTIKSGPNKDLLNPLGEMTPVQRAMLQEIVDTLHLRFISLVAEGRKLTVDQVRDLADGRIFSATRALEARLVDSAVGYWPDAVTKTRELLGQDKIRVLRYEESFNWRSLFTALQRRPVIVVPNIASAGRTKIQYLWEPH